MSTPPIGSVHHVELWVPDIDRAAAEWGWLLTNLGYQSLQEWPGGRSWILAGTYTVVEESPDLTADTHERQRLGLNHLAFYAGEPACVDALTADAPTRGWTLLFPDQHPHAGGPDSYTAYLANIDGYEAELTADRS